MVKPALSFGRGGHGDRSTEPEQIAQRIIDIKSVSNRIDRPARLEQARHSSKRIRRQLQQSQLRTCLPQRSEFVRRADETRIPVGGLLWQRWESLVYDRRQSPQPSKNSCGTGFSPATGRTARLVSS